MASTIRAYAQALYDTALDRPKAEVKEVVARLAAELRDKQLLNRAPELIREIERLDDEEEGIVRASVVSAHKLSKSVLEEVASMVKRRSQAKTVVFEETIDASILGGVVIRFKDTILDLSLAERVNALSQEIKK